MPSVSAHARSVNRAERGNGRRRDSVVYNLHGILPHRGAAFHPRPRQHSRDRRVRVVGRSRVGRPCRRERPTRPAAASRRSEAGYDAWHDSGAAHSTNRRGTGSVSSRVSGGGGTGVVVRRQRRAKEKEDGGERHRQQEKLDRQERGARCWRGKTSSIALDSCGRSPCWHECPVRSSCRRPCCCCCCCGCPASSNNRSAPDISLGG